MPAPVTYSETTLVDFLHLTLGDTAAVLGWATTDYRFYEIVYEVLLAYGVATIGEATDIRKLRALARVEVWRAVVQATAGEHDYETATASFSRSQIHKQAVANLEAAEQEAARFIAASPVIVLPTRTPLDPYVAPHVALGTAE